MRKLDLPIFLVFGAIIHLQISSSLLNPSDVQTSSTEGLCIYSYDSDRYTCELYNAVIKSPNEVLTITGNHLPDHSDLDVKVVIHRNVSIQYFNGEVLRKFTNLEYLAMGGVNVSEISENAFDVCGKLDRIYIGFTAILTFPQRMLQNCVNLRHFHSYSNRVTWIPEDLFGDATNLEIFEADANQLISLPNNLLMNMRNLKRFLIRSNFITNIDRSLLVNAENLEEVDLSYNSISDTSVITNLLNGHGTLKLIRMRRNRFTTFDFTFFSQFTQLNVLEISGETSAVTLNGIDWKALPVSLTRLDATNIGEEIPSDAFRHLTNLRRLVLSGNGITSLHEDTFKELVDLDWLTISYTQIRTIPSNIFVHQTNLRLLNLAYNCIEELPEGVFAPLANLGVNRTWIVDSDLCLTGNRIRRINANSFGHHPHLEYLRLDSNEISEIESVLFARFPIRMQRVDLTNNNCTNGYFLYQSDLQEDKRLENCFNNWAGITTTAAPGNAFGIRADLSSYLMLFLSIICQLCGKQ